MITVQVRTHTGGGGGRREEEGGESKVVLMRSKVSVEEYKS